MGAARVAHYYASHFQDDFEIKQFLTAGITLDAQSLHPHASLTHSKERKCAWKLKYGLESNYNQKISSMMTYKNW